jgi:hypothetical protein
MTNDERRKSRSHHVVHDYVNLISAATEMNLMLPRTGIERRHQPPLNSHLQASFVLHYRKFDDFFANQRKRPGKKKKRCMLLHLLNRPRKTTEADDFDMLAKDFVSSRIRYKLPEWRRWHDHMNGHLFHLNTFRTRNTRPWEGHTEVLQMLKEFQDAWKSFFDALPDAARSDFKEEIALKFKPGSEFADLDLYGG